MGCSTHNYNGKATALSWFPDLSRPTEEEAVAAHGAILLLVIVVGFVIALCTVTVGIRLTITGGDDGCHLQPQFCLQVRSPSIKSACEREEFSHRCSLVFRRLSPVGGQDAPAYRFPAWRGVNASESPLRIP